MDVLMYDELDLDINNYSYADLLGLFKLQYDFNEDDLKNAKKIVLKMHPDKSKLPPKYFLFFSKAYKNVYSIYEFKNKTAKTEKMEDVKDYNGLIKIVPKKDDPNSKILKTFIESNDMRDPKKFNEWFNNQFDKLNKDKEEENDNDGYGSWFKSDEGVTTEIAKTKDEMATVFDKKRKDLKSLVKYEGVQDMYSNALGASVLYGEESNNFSSDLFGSFAYQDLRQAHTETVVPIDEDDYASVPKFNNVNEYQRHRDSQQFKPLSEKEAASILSNEYKKKEEAATKRAYYYAKEVEKSKEKTNTFWSSLKQLGN
jgi:hypothetical protein